MVRSWIGGGAGCTDVATPWFSQCWNVLEMFIVSVSSESCCLKTHPRLSCQMKVYLTSNATALHPSDEPRRSITVARRSSLLFPYRAVELVQTHTGEWKWTFVLAPNVSGRKLAMCWNNSARGSPAVTHRRAPLEERAEVCLETRGCAVNSSGC